MDPRVELRPFERRLLALWHRAGARGFVVLLTLASVLLSLAVTAVAVGLRSDVDTTMAVYSFVIAAAIPLCVAPLAGIVATRLLGVLDRALRHLEPLTRLDSLTGACNRRAFTDDAEILLGTRPGALVAMADIDDFKAVNDTHGHATGDGALRVLADQLRVAAGPDAVIGRLGGDEFAIVVPLPGPQDEDRDGATGALMVRLRRACDLSSVVPGLHASYGACTAEPGAGLSGLLRGADLALYAEKGRRRANPRHRGLAA